MKDLGTLGGTQSEATDINNGGQVVGYAETTNDRAVHAFLHSGTTMIDLGALSGGDSQAQSINDVGQIVGTASVTGDVWHAFLYSGSTMTDLNTLINSPGWTLQQASGINDAGQIVGSGTIGGHTHAFLLTPTPEPSSMVLLIVAGISLLGYARRRRTAPTM